MTSLSQIADAFRRLTVLIESTERGYLKTVLTNTNEFLHSL